MASTSDFKNGLILRIKDSLWKIVEFQHVKPGKGAAFVRSKLKILQIEFVENMTKKKGGCILDGRDIGTKILPNADFKFYVDAPLEIRAKRRFEQLYSNDKSIKFKNILIDLEKRDYNDKSRDNSPLVLSKDSILLNTEFLNPNQVLKKALSYIKKSK